MDEIEWYLGDRNARRKDNRWNNTIQWRPWTEKRVRGAQIKWEDNRRKTEGKYTRHRNHKTKTNEKNSGKPMSKTRRIERQKKKKKSITKRR